MDTLAIIKRIEIRLSEIGMTKAEFYEKSKISSASFSQWRTGKYKPSEKNLVKAAEVLGVSYSYLLNGVEEKENAPVTDDESDVLDQVDIAFYGDFKKLCEDDKATIRDMVRVMRERRSKKQE
ncbi:MAG: helix-turn-helix domain-containing protein [Oscillospiraceae bacterium]|nr:helix-turn-helix domain-containing protein [Oscillospiraceae bacterium]